MFWMRNLCRLCGEIGNHCYNIFDPALGLELKLKKCLINIEISFDDFKPKEICHSCYNKLNSVIEFMDLCLSTNMKFDSLYCSESYPPSMLSHPDGHKQSVIVSNKQRTEESSLYPEPNKLEFNVDYNNTPRTTSSEKPLVLSGNLPSDLLEGLEHDVTDDITECLQSKDLISVGDIQKSLEINPSSIERKTSQKRKEKTYPCPHCEKVFKRRINLTAHISSHTNIREYKCSVCPKTFAVKCFLTQHDKIHSELFKCSICHKRFGAPSKLVRHMNTHTLEKPFACDVPNCNKAFSDKHNLKQHVLSHTAERNMTCNICEKLFKTKKHLNAHIKNHINGNLFQCSYCSKHFRYKHSLKSHMLKHYN